MLLNVDLSSSVTKLESVASSSAAWSPTNRNKPIQLLVSQSMPVSHKSADIPSASGDIGPLADPQCKRSGTLPANIGRGAPSRQGSSATHSISGIISKALGKSDGFGTAGVSSDSDDDDYRLVFPIG